MLRRTIHYTATLFFLPTAPNFRTKRVNILTNHSPSITYAKAALVMLRQLLYMPNHCTFIATEPGCELSFGYFSLAVKEK